MPGTVYTVASGKGGVGKTTTTVNLGVALWQEGNAVAIVDADLGMANLSAVLGLEPEVTLHDVLAGETILEEAVVEAKGGDLLVVAGSRDLEGFAAANPQKLKDVLENLAARCDYVIVDTGAGLGYEDVLPLGLADAVILVSSADPASLGDTRKTAELAELVETPVMGVVVTRAVAGTDSEAIAAEIGAPLLGTVPEDPAVMEATVAGDPLASHAPKSDATAAYMELGRSVIEAEGRSLEDVAPPEKDAGDAEEAATTDEPGADGEDDVADAEGADEEGGDAADVADQVEAAGTDQEDDAPEVGDSTPDAAESDDHEESAPEADPTDEEPAEPGTDDEAAEPAPDTTDEAEAAGGTTEADEDAERADEDGDAEEPASVAEEADDSEGSDDGEAPADPAEAEPAATDDGSEAAPDAEGDAEGEVEDEPETSSGGLSGWLGRLFS